MSAIRMLFLSIAAVMVLGICLTGFEKVHRLLYVPPAFLTFAGLTGICPGFIFWSWVGFKSKPLACGLPSRKN